MVAIRLGYRHVKSLDSFLRRRDYIWDRYQKCYVKKPMETMVSGDWLHQPPDLVARVLALWEAPDADAKTYICSSSPSTEVTHEEIKRSLKEI